MRRLLSIGLLSTLGTGCSFDVPMRTCSVDDECVKDDVAGICVASGGAAWCAFPSTDCTTGFEFGPLAGDGLAGDCVSADRADGGVDAGLDAMRAPDASIDACAPTTEICDDEIDNDCDGTIDLDDDDCTCSTGEARACGTDLGECTQGTQNCVDSTWGPCEGEIGPVAEACNGLDDDCDGTIDNGDNACGGACTITETPGVACDGGDTDSCEEGFWGCVDLNSIACSDATGDDVEVCNAVDDNCDGTTDEGCSCVDGTMQSCGTDEGDCIAGTQTCSGGTWGTCVGEVGPSGEICNGRDDDCDAMTDEGDPGGGAVCSTGGMGVCAAGTEHCSGGSVICVPDATPSSETCNSLDDDCNGLTDEGCPSAPALRFPWNGYTTGSVHATAAGLTVKPRRPQFRWSPIAGVTMYELQVDDSCVTPGFSACAFATPEVNISTAVTSYTPTTDLPVSTSAPVGRRYYWRVRACNPVGCSVWSPVRYVDVGRLSNDFNGDGYGDVAVGAPANDAGGMDAGRVYVYFGSSAATIEGTADVTLTGASALDNFGGATAAAGDVNGDGFADLIVGAPQADAGGMTVGRAYVFYGGTAAAFDSSPDGTFTGAGADDAFGASVAGAGDVNGDGYADVIVGAYQNDAGGANAGRAYVYYGGSGVTIDATADGTLTGLAASNSFGRGVAGGGDINDDGYCDVIVGAPNAGTGQAYVFHGGPTASLDATADGTVSGEAVGDGFGKSVANAGDINGDGYADVIVGAWSNDVGGANAGRAYVYYGGALPALDATADGILPGAAAGDEFGDAVAGGGDVNGDGYADVIVGARNNDAGGMNFGRVYVYYGSAAMSLDTTADGNLTGTTTEGFGISVAVGDVNGDGYTDVKVGASTGNHAYVYNGGSFIMVDGTPDGTLTGGAGDFFGTSIARLDGAAMVCFRAISG